MKSVLLDRRKSRLGLGGSVAADFLSLVLGLEREPSSSSRAPGGKVGTVVWVSTFPGGARPGGGNVKIPPVLRDFQEAVGSVENLGLVFHAFHGPGISTALRLRYRNGGSGDCTLHCRSSRDLAAFIWRAHAVSLIASASRSNSARLRPGLRYCSARSSDFSFSNGVR